ncbi:hypothetical protein BDQ17DRAFT_1348822 [Cyathus striatus]|nr:hypothetical protein BDQ17DRAFT_1348822 [Cyathus striatus]
MSLLCSGSESPTFVLGSQSPTQPPHMRLNVDDDFGSEEASSSPNGSILFRSSPDILSDRDVGTSTPPTSSPPQLSSSPISGEMVSKLNSPCRVNLPLDTDNSQTHGHLPSCQDGPEERLVDEDKADSFRPLCRQTDHTSRTNTPTRTTARDNLSLNAPYSRCLEKRKSEQGSCDTFDPSTFPTPKRMTLASQNKQYKKLSAPFRSPLLPKDVTAPTISSVTSDEVASVPPILQQFFVPRESRKKYRTAKATSQFKSPLTSIAKVKAVPLVRLTPAIQSLELKLQLLKQAVKIKGEDGEEELSNLVQKWTDAGREVAWQVWSLVKDNVREDVAYDLCALSSTKQPVKGFGEYVKGEPLPMHYEDDQYHIEEGELSRSNGDFARHIHEDEDDNRSRDSLGTMLTRLGIPHETLGWDETENSFADT